MKTKNDGEKGVSYTVGVLLMLILTIALSAMIAITVSNLAGHLKTTPMLCLIVEDHKDEVSFGNDKLVTIEHINGDYIRADEISILVETDSYKERLEYDKNKNQWIGKKLIAEMTADNGISRIIEAGDVIVIRENSNLIDSPEEVTVEVVHKQSNAIIFRGSILVR